MADDQGISFEDAMASPDTGNQSGGMSFEDVMQGQAQDQGSQGSSDGGMSFEDAMQAPAPQERTWGQEIGRDLRTFARGVIPTTAGVLGAIGAGGLAAETGPGAIAAGLAGGAAAGFAAQKAQDEITDALGIDSPEARAADAANPNIGSKIAEFAPAAISLGTGGLSTTLAQRALSGGLMGAVDLGTQAATKGVSNIDPTEAAVAAGAGAAFTSPRGWVPNRGNLLPKASGTPRADANVNADVPDPAEHRVATQASPAATSDAVGTAQEKPQAVGYRQDYTGGMEAPPGEFGAGTGDIGRDLKKDSPAAAEGVVGADDNPGVQDTEPGELAPDMAAALSGSPVTPEKPRIRVPAGSRPVEPDIRPDTAGVPEQPNLPPEGQNVSQATPEVPGAAENAANRPPILRNALNQNDVDQINSIFGTGNDKAFSPEEIQRVLQETRANPAGGLQEQSNEVTEPSSAPEQPQPQNLSGGATENPSFSSAADRLKQVSKLGDAIKNFGPVKWFRQAFIPEGLTEDTKAFENIVREGQGVTNRTRAQYDRNMNDLERAINNTPAEAREDFARNFQTGQLANDNPLKKLAPDALRTQKAYTDRFAQEDPDGNFQTNILPRFFADREGAKNFATDWKETRTGIPTVGDFMQAGFRPDKRFLRQDGSVDPVKLMQGLHGSYDQFLESKHILNQSLDDGIVFGSQAPGTVALDGATTGGRPLYATPDVATMWNRYFGEDARDITGKTFLQTVQRIKNATTAFQLIGGGYHMFAETQEAMVGDLMRAISEAAAGRFGEAGKRAAGAPLAPYRQFAKSGKAAIEAYYDPDKATPEVREAIDYLVKAGFSPKRIQRYTPEYNVTRGFFEGWEKAANKLDLQEMAAQAKTGPVGAGKSAFQLVGKGMQSVMEPLFNTYIPRLKAGAALEQMSDYISANPGKSAKQYQEMAKRIIKSTDDRLGELSQSTLFWNNTLKKAANLLMISPGWETGTIRAAIGGMKSLVTNPARMSIQHPDFQPNAAWPFAFAITTAAVGSLYEFLKTGKMPQDVRDPFFPKTGGTAPRSSLPERAILPGYLKDVYGWWHGLSGQEGMTRNASSMLYNKLALVPRATWELMANKDWAGQQIYNPSDPMQKKLRDYLGYVQENMAPIVAKQQTERDKGTNISRPEAFFGIRGAPAHVQKAQQSEAGIREANKREQDKAKRFHERIGH